MRFIDYILKEPIFNTTTGGKFDKTLLLAMPPVPFVVDNVAKQLIEGLAEAECHTTATGLFHSNTVKFTDVGKELLFSSGPSLMSIVDAVPPYESCFFEYRPHWQGAGAALFEGVWLLSGEYVERAYLAGAQTGDPDTEHVLLATVFNRYLSQDGLNLPINDCQGVALIKLDANWDLIRLVPHPDMPNRKELLVTLASLMLLGTKVASSVQSTTPQPTRRERRKARNAGTKPQPGARFWTLKLNVPDAATDTPGHSAGGGWTVAWHRVRGHLRRLKSGKVVKVRPHTKGDLLKGIVLKNYELTMAATGMIR
jgi:hypothetical protein